MVVVLSNVTYELITHEFLFQHIGIQMDIPKVASFDIDLPNYTADIVNTEGFVRKTVKISGMLKSDDGGDSASVKLFALANFLRINTHNSLTLNIQMDGGALVKTYIGKFIGSFISGIANSRPLDLQFSFNFVIESSSW